MLRIHASTFQLTPTPALALPLFRRQSIDPDPGPRNTIVPPACGQSVFSPVKSNLGGPEAAGSPRRTAVKTCRVRGLGGLTREYGGHAHKQHHDGFAGTLHPICQCHVSGVGRHYAKIVAKVQGAPWRRICAGTVVSSCSLTLCNGTRPTTCKAP